MSSRSAVAGIVAGIVATLCWFVAVYWWTSQPPDVRDPQAMEFIHAVL